MSGGGHFVCLFSLTKENPCWGRNCNKWILWPDCCCIIFGGKLRRDLKPHLRFLFRKFNFWLYRSGSNTWKSYPIMCLRFSWLELLFEWMHPNQTNSYSKTVGHNRTRVNGSINENISSKQGWQSHRNRNSIAPIFSKKIASTYRINTHKKSHLLSHHKIE